MLATKNRGQLLEFWSFFRTGPKTNVETSMPLNELRSQIVKEFKLVHEHQKEARQKELAFEEEDRQGDEESKEPYSPDEEHICKAPRKNLNNIPSCLDEAREDIEVSPFTLGGDDISGVDLITCDAKNRCSSTSSYLNGSGFGGLSDTAISDVALSNGSMFPVDSGRRVYNPDYVGEQSHPMFMDMASLAKGVTILPSSKMLR